MDIKCKLKTIGNAFGLIETGNKVYTLSNKTDDLPDAEILNIIEIDSRKGKFADSEDSFLFVYFEIDPFKENFDLSARFEVLESEEVPDYQTGFGIMAADTVFSGDDSINSFLCIHRNHLLLGRCRTAYGRNYGYSLRAVGGYTSPKANEYDPVRKLDPTREFKIQETEDIIRPGDACVLRLTKTDKGFTGIIQCKGECESIVFPGCDFLMQQDKDHLSVGFAIAGKIRLKISEIHVQKSEGKPSPTPADAIRNVIPDYPFQRDTLEEKPYRSDRNEKRTDTVLYVSPEGRSDQSGSESSPMDLYSAVSIAAEGTEIRLLDGIYYLEEPLYLPEYSGGNYEKRCSLRAEHPRKAVLDGSRLKKKIPLFILRGRFWNVEGLTFQNSPLSGLLICGSGNRVSDCEACHNGDSGVLICAYPGESREKWPSYNQIEDCDSYDNCDPVLCNADGFGAKLRIGKGNGFYRCIAHHNIDDGFDLYTKSIIGPIEPVVLEKCIAYENGKTLEDRFVRKNHSGGIGFKLGGEKQAVSHEVWDCLSLMNNQYGFSSNSNPAVRLHFCTSLQNGRKGKRDNFRLNNESDNQRLPRNWEGLFPKLNANGKESIFSVAWGLPSRLLTKGICTERKADGSISISKKYGLYKMFFRKGALAVNYKKKNILMLISSLGGGGAERVTSILASELSKRHEVYLLYMNKKEQNYYVSPAVHLIDASWSNGTVLQKVFHLPYRYPFIACSVLRSKQKYNIDATVSMLYKPNIYNSLIRWRDRRIMSERNDPSRKPEREFSDAKKSYRRADHVVFQSEKVKNLFSEEVQKKSSIIRNPIGVSCYADKTPKKKIVTVGRYTIQKNHALLIKAFAGFYRNHAGYTLHFYGDGKLREEMEEQIKELGLENAVFLEGFKDDVHRHISDAKMFVLSSDYEGMSNALMEAMRMGLPCISTNCTGSDELLTDGETGLLVPVGDANALAAAMSTLADDETLCERLRLNAQMLSMEFEKEKVVRAWERILFR